MSKPDDVSFFLLLLVICSQDHRGRLLLSDFNQSTSSDLISDGVHHHHHRSHTFAPYLTLKNALSAEDSICEQTYWFLLCTTTMIANFSLPNIPVFSLEGSGDPCFDVSLASRGLRATNCYRAFPSGPLGLHRQHTLDFPTRALWLCLRASPLGNSPR